MDETWVSRFEAWAKEAYGKSLGVNVTVNNGAVPGALFWLVGGPGRVRYRVVVCAVVEGTRELLAVSQQLRRPS
jgi:hypothetical protein